VQSDALHVFRKGIVLGQNLELRTMQGMGVVFANRF
jgi:hypothetical protein